jgi:hypothetical protein
MRPSRIALGSLLALMGCATGWWLSSSKQREIPFTHKTHVVGQEMECVVCHETAEEEDKAGMPPKDTCITCHGPKEDRPPKDFEKKLQEATELKFPLWNRSPDVIFSHKTHLAKGLKCEQCHGDVTNSTELDERVVVRMEACMACHAAEGKPNECATCHKEYRADVRPAFHDQAFLRTHGQTLRGQRDRTAADRCQLCHAPSSTRRCDGCHSEVPPLDHTEFWRRRAHGFAAEVDRDRCSACHREDFCQRCHASTIPQSHTGAWATRFQEHCLSCHEPVSSTPCFTCHKSTPAHQMAPRRPAPPHPGSSSDCRQCHLPGRLLPHADNGGNCSFCHK